MQALSKLWQYLQPKFPAIMVVLAVLVVVPLVVLGINWYRKRKRAAPATGGHEVIGASALRNLRKRFFKALPFRYRATVRNFPTLVVLGPAGSGKSAVIDQELDWRRQASQFMPSLTSEPLLQIYLGGDAVVQELSAPLLADDTASARKAFIKLWRETFKEHEPMVVIVLDALWLVQASPDEVRRVSQLLRGKINLLAEIVRSPVETRMCLTHADQVEGFTEFARLMRDNGVPLTFALPPRGEEARIAAVLKDYEKYLATALTSLSVESFDRLENFFRHGADVFAGLARFARLLWEGGTTARPPKMTNLYLFSPDADARSADVFDLPQEIQRPDLSPRYRRQHLRRAALIVAAGTLPILGVYGNMYYAVRHTMADVRGLKERVGKELSEGRADGCGSVIDADLEATVRTMAGINNSTRFWPPLKSSFREDRNEARATLAEAVRECYLMPLLSRCQRVEKKGRYEGPLCSREQTLYLLSLLYGSREDDLGRFILETRGDGKDASQSLSQVRDDVMERVDKIDFENLDDFAVALHLKKNVIASYVGAREVAFDTSLPEALKRFFRTALGDAKWDFMPFENRTLDQQLVKWKEHFEMLDALMVPEQTPLAGPPGGQSQSEEDDVDEGGERVSGSGGGSRRAKATAPPADTSSSEREKWANLVKHGRPLRQELEEARPFRGIEDVVRLLEDSHARGVKIDDIAGLPSRIQALRWMNKNRDALDALFRMEDQADHGYRQAEDLSRSDLLTRTEGLFLPGDVNARLAFEVSGEPFAFEPVKVSKVLLAKLVNSWEQSGRLAFLNRQPAEEESDLPSSLHQPPVCQGIVSSDGDRLPPVMARAAFDSEVKPSLDDFTRRMAQTRLSPEEASERNDYVLSEAEKFALRYRAGLLCTFHRYTFAPNLQRALANHDGKDNRNLARYEKALTTDLFMLAKPANPLADMLRDVAQRANLGSLEGVYFDPIRNAVAPFKSIVRVMTPDKDGLYPELNKYLVMVGQFANAAELAQKDGSDKAAKGEEGEKGAVTEAALVTTEASPADAEKGAAVKGGAPADDKAKASTGEQRLMDKLSPLGRITLPILLGSEGSYLKKVDAWLDGANIIGEFRNPFRQPFLIAATIGRREIEQVIADEWSREYTRVVKPLLSKYPFDPRSSVSVDPPELDVLRRKDGRFWVWVDHVILPVVDQDGPRFTPRKIIQREFDLPPELIATLNRFAGVADLLWDANGNRKPIALQVRPLRLDDKLPGLGADKKTPLGDDPIAGKSEGEEDNQIYVTMAYLKAGSAVCYGYNQQPAWLDFPVQWWNQESASVGIQLTSPDRDGRQYRSIDVAQGWSLYRLLAMATRSANNEYTWAVRTGTLASELAGLTQKKKQRLVSFALRGDPWAPFRSWK